MADDFQETLANQDLAVVEAEADTKTGPAYRIYDGSKIPVSKHVGRLWATRRDQSLKLTDSSRKNWEEAVRYFDNDQTRHRIRSDGDYAGNNPVADRENDEFSETENVVFSNCTSNLDFLYAKNPEIEVTAINAEYKNEAALFKRLVTTLFSRDSAPGINIKPKMKRAILTAMLTNKAFLKIGYTQKGESSEDILEELQQLSEQYQKAEDQEEIAEIEGKLKSLEEQVDMLSSSGPYIKNVLPFDIVVDPSSVEPDLSDANWLMEADYLSTSYVKAKFYKQNEDGDFESLYNSTHIWNKSASDDSEYKWLGSDVSELRDAEVYGYNDDFDTYERMQLTKVWYVWDKTTRRLLMFHDKDWSWPIWVWDDPYNLPNFFPYYPLWFHESVTGQNPKGEVTYYLDQQDTINEALDQMKRARNWGKRHWFYDKNSINEDDFKRVMEGPDGVAKGIDVPEGKSISDLFGTVPHPSLNFQQLYDTGEARNAISRTIGFPEYLRGGQFKTNTTNKAVEAYTDSANNRFDAKRDAIEDVVGKIGKGIIHLCIKFMQQDVVEQLIGTEYSESWPITSDPKQFEAIYNLNVVGNSTEKPNSMAKKQEALELLQTLGQFASSTPYIALIGIQAIEKAFQGIVIDKRQWDLLEQSILNTVDGQYQLQQMQIQAQALQIQLQTAQMQQVAQQGGQHQQEGNPEQQQPNPEQMQ